MGLAVPSSGLGSRVLGFWDLSFGVWVVFGDCSVWGSSIGLEYGIERLKAKGSGFDSGLRVMGAGDVREQC